MKFSSFISFVACLGIMGLCSCSSSVKNTETDENQEAVEVSNAPAAEDAVIELKPGDKIAANPSIPTFVDFNATWCGPCQNFKPIYHEVAKKFEGKVQFLSVDVDQCPELAKEYGVSSIPQITLIMPDGTVTSTVGSRSLEEFVSQVEAAIK